MRLGFVRHSRSWPPVGSGVSFRFGFRFQGAPNCSFVFYSDAGCTNWIDSGCYSPDAYNPLWTQAGPITGITPAGTASVQVSCSPSVPFPGVLSTYDQMYFNTSGGGF